MVELIESILYDQRVTGEIFKTYPISILVGLVSSETKLVTNAKLTACYASQHNPYSSVVIKEHP
jgi:hypothetical protein